MRSFARKNLHRTGALNDSGKVEARLDQILTALRDETGLDTVGSILEIGPGQTSYLIFQLNEHLKPEASYVSDIVEYFPDAYWLERGVEPLHGDLSGIDDGSIDLIFCFDVLEHVPDADGFLGEVSRVLSPRGIFFASWDLRDHLFIHDETRWFDMHRFSETLWMLQRSHRTSYSNRLLPDQWDALFERNGLRALHSVAEQSPIAQRGLRERAGIEVSDVFRLRGSFGKVEAAGPSDRSQA